MPIRLLTPADAPAYAALRREMLADSPWAFAAGPETDIGVDPAAVAARLAEMGQAIVGAWSDESRSRLIGAAGLVRHRHAKMAHRALIWGVYISPPARGRGIGEATLRQLLNIARSWPGLIRVELSVSQRATAAARLYERLGFQAWGTEPDALVVDGRAYSETHMVYDLHPPQPETRA